MRPLIEPPITTARISILFIKDFCYCL